MLIFDIINVLRIYAKKRVPAVVYATNRRREPKNLRRKY
jgi:hypothetical protein